MYGPAFEQSHGKQARVAVVCIHGLAKKPDPDTLTGLWLIGLSRDNPRPDVFAPPNEGINLKVGVPYHFNPLRRRVLRDTDYDTDIDSYYESASGTQENEVAAERLRGKGHYEANEGVLIKAIA